MAWEFAVASALGQHLANKSNKKQAMGQSAFQQRMSNTGYQRAMADMRAAGLNPMLAGKLGPASTPQGARAQIGNIGAAAAQGFQQGAAGEASIASAKQSEETVKKINEEVQNLKQTREFQKILHDERWPRLAATMGPDNVIASAIMTMKGLKPEEILQAPGVNRVINDHKVNEMLELFQEYKSIVSREYAGIRGTGKKVVTRAVEGGKEITRQAIEGIRFVMDAMQEYLK